MADYSPMMSHYLSIKKTLPDTLVFYRLGDFYEMFFDDAKVASAVLELVLTGRNAGVKERVPMCGVPAHAVNSYLNRLVNSGFKVAIVEQMEEANGKTMVNREIIRIVTPGTNLDEQEDAMIVAIDQSADYYYLALYNINVGVIYRHRIPKQLYFLQQLIAEYNIKEIITAEDDELKLENVVLSRCDIQDYKLSEVLSDQVSDEPLYLNCLSRLLRYLEITQKQQIDSVKEIRDLIEDQHLILDYNSKLHLELINDQHDPQKISLYRFLNNCKSALGNRCLKRWVESPLRNIEPIQYRLDIIKYLNKEFLIKNEISEHLKEIYDIERILARINYHQANNKDLLTLKVSIQRAAAILELMDEPIWQKIKVENDCRDVADLLERALNDDPETFNKENRIFKNGYNEELDYLKDIQANGEKWIFEMEKELKEATNIKNLKIGYNKVFGYYIEISKGNLELIKDEFGFIRKQTLVNGERFITEKLKQKEEEIIRSYDQTRRLEKSLFEDLVSEVEKQVDNLQKLAVMIGWVDSICSLATVSNQYGYVEPVFNDQGILNIVNGKHPILAKTLEKDYVANSCHLDKETTTLLITGPNMGGKSTYIRQVALGVVMAQMGCFVCAEKFEAPLFDQIFTRIGASDDITGGQSTFMVEMNEANLALQKATENSLVLFDELGRGTSTYDGMSLAQAMIEYLTICVRCKVLFSTHYHELVQLEDSLKGLMNVNVQVKETKDQIVFLYNVVPGKANKSYGINVAKLAHLPESVIERANQLLKEYEENHRFRQNELIVEMIKESPAYKKLKDKINDIDINGITPIKALNLLVEIKELVEEDEQ